MKHGIVFAGGYKPSKRIKLTEEVQPIAKPIPMEEVGVVIVEVDPPTTPVEEVAIQSPVSNECPISIPFIATDETPPVYEWKPIEPESMQEVTNELPIEESGPFVVRGGRKRGRKKNKDKH